MKRTIFVATILASTLALTSCADNEPSQTAGNSPVTFDEFDHVHGVGTNPSNGLVYVASHSGVYRLDDRGAVRVADRYQDTMGFAVTGPDTFIGSGHPDLRETDLPPQLGLIVSTDAGQTWKSRSLSGEADLHALDTLGDLIVAYDASSNRVISSRDGLTWESLAETDAIDLALAPDATIWAIDTTGRLARITDDQLRPVSTSNLPPIVALDATPDGLLVAATPEGRVYTSTDGTAWEQVGSVASEVQALDVTDRWLLVSAAAVLESTDQGRTWKPLLASAT